MNTALIFWFFFIKEKEQHTTISRLTKQTLAKTQVNGIGRETPSRVSYPLVSDEHVYWKGVRDARMIDTRRSLAPNAVNLRK